jgi:hypothetical protein
VKSRKDRHTAQEIFHRQNDGPVCDGMR